MKSVIFVVGLVLVGCGTVSEQLEPVIVAIDVTEGQPTKLESLEAPDCSWNIAEVSMSEKSFDAGGYVLPYRYSTKDGPVYSLAEGSVTRWVHIVGETMSFGMKCERTDLTRSLRRF